MHGSRLGGVIIDCHTEDLDGAARYWSKALGWPAERSGDPADVDYVQLVTPPGELDIEVQRVTHSSRVHIDIETDDFDAEARRLEALGARVVERIRTWVVMEAPTGQRFCLVRPQRDDFEQGASAWD